MTSKALILALTLGTTALTMQAANAQVYGNVGVHIGPPPPPIVERRPPPPGYEYGWHGGHWYWNGYRYVWHGGYWARRPYARAEWIPGHWTQGPHGWYFHEGHWS
jgi:hypothetical protein